MKRQPGVAAERGPPVPSAAGASELSGGKLGGLTARVLGLTAAKLDEYARRGCR
ncbi:MAG: hypothetical protein ACLTSG_08015 [Lachnospiraceae bacterium]